MGNQAFRIGQRTAGIFAIAFLSAGGVAFAVMLFSVWLTVSTGLLIEIADVGMLAALVLRDVVSRKHAQGQSRNILQPGELKSNRTSRTFTR